MIEIYDYVCFWIQSIHCGLCIVKFSLRIGLFALVCIRVRAIVCVHACVHVCHAFICKRVWVDVTDLYICILIYLFISRFYPKQPATEPENNTTNSGETRDINEKNIWQCTILSSLPKMHCAQHICAVQVKRVIDTFTVQDLIICVCRFPLWGKYSSALKAWQSTHAIRLPLGLSGTTQMPFCVQKVPSRNIRADPGLPLLFWPLPLLLEATTPSL